MTKRAVTVIECQSRPGLSRRFWPRNASRSGDNGPRLKPIFWGALLEGLKAHASTLSRSTGLAAEIRRRGLTTANEKANCGYNDCSPRSDASSMDTRPRTTLSEVLLREIGEGLEREHAVFRARYPGPSGERQPIHTYYCAGDVFRRDMARTLGDLALLSLEEFAPDFITFAKAIGLRGSGPLAGCGVGGEAGAIDRERPRIRAQGKPRGMACPQRLHAGAREAFARADRGFAYRFRGWVRQSSLGGGRSSRGRGGG